MENRSYTTMLDSGRYPVFLRFLWEKNSVIFINQTHRLFRIQAYFQTTGHDVNEDAMKGNQNAEEGKLKRKSFSFVKWKTNVAGRIIINYRIQYTILDQRNCARSVQGKKLVGSGYVGCRKILNVTSYWNEH